MCRIERNTSVCKSSFVTVVAKSNVHQIQYLYVVRVGSVRSDFRKCVDMKVNLAYVIDDDGGLNLQISVW